MLGWELYQDQYNGYFYVQNDLEENRLTMDKDTTGMLLALRLIYDENSERAGLNQDVVCYVRDLLEKTVTDFAILKQKPNMRDVRKSLQLMENHCIIARLDGRFNEMGCRFTILPTILTAVSTERLNILVERMKTSVILRVGNCTVAMFTKQKIKYKCKRQIGSHLPKNTSSL